MRGLEYERTASARSGALTVLERIGSKSAQSLLEALGKGAPGVHLTEEARLTQARLALLRSPKNK